MQYVHAKVFRLFNWLLSQATVYRLDVFALLGKYYKLSKCRILFQTPCVSTSIFNRSLKPIVTSFSRYTSLIIHLCFSVAAPVQLIVERLGQDYHRQTLR